MILSIARKELVDAWRDGRFRLAALLVCVLVGVSGLLARQQLARTQAERAAASALERENWLEQGEKNSHSAGHYGVNVFKPTAPLSAFDRGLEPFVGTTVFLEAHRQNQTAFLPAQDATAMRRFGELSSALALQVLVPLLVVLLCFGAVAGERESGTLRQLLSLGVRPRDLVLGKALGLYACMLLLLLPAALVLVGLVLASPAELRENVRERAAWLALLYLGYVALFVALAVGVSAWARTSRAALSVLLCVWAGNCVLAPRLASDLVHARLATPRLAEFEAALEADLSKGLDGHDSRDEHMQKFQQETLQKHGKTSLEELPFNFMGLAMLESERFSSEVYRSHFGRLWDRLAEQDRAVTQLGLAAPLLALRSASAAFAGTDFAHHRHFAEAAESYRFEFVKLLNEDLMVNARPGDHGYTVGRELWEKLPPFELAPLDVATVRAHAGTGLRILALWVLGAVLFLLLSTKRLGVVSA
jgi:ABC-2 type transport system permease protein